MKALVACVLLVVACDRSTPSATSESVPGVAPVAAPVAAHARTPAHELIDKFQCSRCHEVPGVQPAVRDKHCFGCHQQIHAGTFDAKPEAIAKWRDHIKSLRDAPSLPSQLGFRSSPTLSRTRGCADRARVQ